MAKKRKGDALDEAVTLAHKNGMSYAEFQQLETQGLAEIKDGKLKLKSKVKEGVK